MSEKELDRILERLHETTTNLHSFIQDKIDTGDEYHVLTMPEMKSLEVHLTALGTLAIRAMHTRDPADYLADPGIGAIDEYLQADS